MKIIIAGAGAMGSRFGLMLHQAHNDVILIDGWQDHLDHINRDGLIADFNGQEIVAKIPAYHQDHANEIDFDADLIIVFTKAMQLDHMMASIQNMIGDQTKILCLLNGLGHEDTLEKYVSKDHILLGNTMWTAGLTGPGKAKLFGDGYLELQSLSTTGKAAADKVIDVLNGAKLNAKYSEHILSSIYRKACVNGTMNGLCTILDSNMADLGATAPIDDIVNSIVNEFAAVAKHEGVELDLDQVLAQIKSCYDRETIGLHYPSMYQDLITNQRLTEIDYINGAIARKGQKYGVATPYCSFLTQLIHCKEELLGAK
ncbi:2-dehydropantoate 2-reductase [Ligilactobacillus pabuli]|uniref:2-dehydropantoate 2-reductase n=1 Tax=Ligilactobacillus pabuli TaxID=2886039 RepID=A0ABQ5JLF8_9LACO|nr:2-dehydropantoate 2-reductase [Ligilactobacillus pabuli]GKS81820.1 2-dehydropantoate 2-reductase [Ligilactobacillus pabuli]HIW89980.1 2-dehydropantoate 2-reductase [Candidatus Ligilactobacillus excrementipullorum]